MRACLPIARDQGLESRVFPHCGSTPMFLVVDTETKATHTIANPECDDEHGRCLPLDAIVKDEVDVVVVGAIGAGALARLGAAGIPVFHGAHGTAAEVLDAVVRGDLLQVIPQDTCGERAGPHDQGCGVHGHRHRHGQHGGGGQRVQLRFRGGRGL